MRSQPWSFPAGLERGELMAQSEDLHLQSHPRPKGGSHCGKHGQKYVLHGRHRLPAGEDGSKITFLPVDRAVAKCKES